MKTKRIPEIVALIPLTQGMFAIVDVADLPSVSDQNWKAKRYGQHAYATRTIRHRDGTWSEQKMHRVIMQPPAHLVVDHINGNGLDNRRSNLRIATKVQNAQNMKAVQGSSPLKGVYWHKQHGKWASTIRVNGKTKSLGLFRTESEAHEAYCAAATGSFGEFARFA